MIAPNVSQKRIEPALDLIKLLAAEQDLTTAMGCKIVGDTLKAATRIFEDASNFIECHRFDLDRALWTALSLNGFRNLGDQLLDVANTDWRQQIAKADEEIRKVNEAETWEARRDAEIGNDLCDG